MQQATSKLCTGTDVSPRTAAPERAMTEATECGAKLMIQVPEKKGRSIPRDELTLAADNRSGKRKAPAAKG